MNVVLSNGGEWLLLLQHNTTDSSVDNRYLNRAEVHGPENSISTVILGPSRRPDARRPSTSAMRVQDLSTGVAHWDGPYQNLRA